MAQNGALPSAGSRPTDRRGRRGLNSTQRSKRSQVRQRDQLLNHGHSTTPTNVPTHGTLLNRTITSGQAMSDHNSGGNRKKSRSKHSGGSPQCENMSNFWAGSKEPDISTTMRMTNLDQPSRDLANISLIPISNISSSLASHFNKTVQLRSAKSGGLSTVKSATQLSNDGNLQSVRAMNSY